MCMKISCAYITTPLYDWPKIQESKLVGLNLAGLLLLLSPLCQEFEPTRMHVHNAVTHEEAVAASTPANGNDTTFVLSA